MNLHSILGSSTLIQGLVLGFLYAMPVGSLNIYIVHTALHQPFSRAMINAFIIALMDMTLAVSCFLGLGILMNHSQWVRLTLLTIGILFLIFSGIKLALTRSVPVPSFEGEEESNNFSIPKLIGTSFALTWLNPQGLLELSALFGGFRASMTTLQGRLFLTGACIGAACWYFGISSFVSLGRSRLTPTVIQKFNLICGLGLVFFGIRLAIDFATSPDASGILTGSY